MQKQVNFDVFRDAVDILYSSIPPDMEPSMSHIKPFLMAYETRSAFEANLRKTENNNDNLDYDGQRDEVTSITNPMRDRIDLSLFTDLDDVIFDNNSIVASTNSLGGVTLQLNEIGCAQINANGFNTSSIGEYFKRNPFVCTNRDLVSLYPTEQISQPAIQCWIHWYENCSIIYHLLIHRVRSNLTADLTSYHFRL